MFRKKFRIQLNRLWWVPVRAWLARYGGCWTGRNLLLPSLPVCSQHLACLGSNGGKVDAKFSLLFPTVIRVNFKTFLVYSVFNVTIYAIPASWLFSQDGWLKQLGGIDYGCGVVNLFSFWELAWKCFFLGGPFGWGLLCSGCHNVSWTEVTPQENIQFHTTWERHNHSKIVSELDSSTAQRRWWWETQHFA